MNERRRSTILIRNKYNKVQILYCIYFRYANPKNTSINLRSQITISFGRKKRKRRKKIKNYDDDEKNEESCNTSDITTFTNNHVRWIHFAWLSSNGLVYSITATTTNQNNNENTSNKNSNGKITWCLRSNMSWFIHREPQLCSLLHMTRVKFHHNQQRVRILCYSSVWICERVKWKENRIFTLKKKTDVVIRRRSLVITFAAIVSGFVIFSK